MTGQSRGSSAVHGHKATPQDMNYEPGIISRQASLPRVNPEGRGTWLVPPDQCMFAGEDTVQIAVRRVPQVFGGCRRVTVKTMPRSTAYRISRPPLSQPPGKARRRLESALQGGPPGGLLGVDNKQRRNATSPPVKNAAWPPFSEDGSSSPLREALPHRRISALPDRRSQGVNTTLTGL